MFKGQLIIITTEQESNTPFKFGYNILDIFHTSENNYINYPFIIDKSGKYEIGDNVYVKSTNEILLNVHGIVKSPFVYKILALPNAFNNVHLHEIQQRLFVDKEIVMIELDENNSIVSMLHDEDDPMINNGFWQDTAKLMEHYKDKEYEQRLQGIIDCRIIFSRYNFVQTSNKNIHKIFKDD